MRTISADQRRTLEDLSAEGLLKGLPVQTAEKDIHITELLRGLSELRVEHDFFSDLARGEKTRHDAGIQLVFAGGTCLSKAHGLISRMSEDIDIKVILQPPASPLKGDRGNRARLKALHQHVEQLLADLGFTLLEPRDEANPFVQDRRRYYVVAAGYQSSYDQLAGLRPHLKLEIIERTPLMPTERRQFGYLYESLAGLPASSPVSIECISVAETAAEKVLSLLRRCAWSWDGYQRTEMDPALVRHIYDVARISEQDGDALRAAREIFPRLVGGDREEFLRQHPGFDADPVGVLRRTLVAARSRPELKQRFSEQLLPLVYEPEPPAYEHCFERFEAVAQDFLSTCARAS